MPRLAALVFALTATIYTHNMALFYLPGIVVFWLVYPSRVAVRTRLVIVALVGALVGLLYIPWLPILVKQATSVHKYFWAPKPSVKDLLSSLCVLSGLDIDVLKGLRYHLPVLGLFGFWTWALLVPAFILLGAIIVWRSANLSGRRRTIALQAYALSPVLLVFLWSRISTSVYVNRNLIGASALLPLVFCAPISVLTGKQKKFFESCTALIVVGVVASLFWHQEQKDDWRGMAGYLLQIPGQQRLVVLFQPYCQILVHYYSTGTFRSNPQPQITGLITDFKAPPREPGILPNIDSVDVNAMLSQAIDSGKYDEIDVALQRERLPAQLQAITGFLKTRCSALEDVQFGKLGVSRCILRAN